MPGALVVTPIRPSADTRLPREFPISKFLYAPEGRNSVKYSHMHSSQESTKPRRDGIRFRTGRFPLLIVDFVEAVNDEEFELFLDTVTLFTKKREPMAVVVNADGIEFMTQSQTEKLVAWLRRNEVGLRNYTLGLAFVAAKAEVRKLLRPVLMEIQTGTDVLLASFEDEGIAFAEGSLEAAGIELPLGFEAD